MSTGGKAPPSHIEVNTYARELRLEFASLPFEGVRRSVLRHWPNKDKARDEVRAKATQPCVLGVQLVGAQSQYMSVVQQRFYPVTAATFPSFASAFRLVSAGGPTDRSWGDVAKRLNEAATPHIHWIFLASPIGIPPSAEKFEEVLNRVVAREGARDIVSLCHACDGTLPFGDYAALRLMGGRVEEVSALAGLARFAENADAVQARMLADGDDVGLWIISDDREPAQLEELRRESQAHKDEEADATSEEEEGGRPSAVPAEDGATSPAAESDADAPAAATPEFPAPENPAETEKAPEVLFRRTNLLSNDPATAVPWRENKAGMHARLAECWLNHICSVPASSLEEALALMVEKGIRYPVVVKPVSGAGSEFVTLCSSDEEVATAFAICANVLTTQRTLARDMVVEEYIDGPEYVVNIVSFEGRHVVTDIWKSWKYPFESESTRMRSTMETAIKEKAAVDSTVAVPAVLRTVSLLYDRQEFVDSLDELAPASEERRVAAYTMACCTALGMINGCSHCEVRVDGRPGSPTHGQPILIELNPRMQGDAPRATQLVGYDQYTLLFYLSAVAAAYEVPQPISYPPRVPTALAPGQATSLPWPPVPVLYRSLQPPPAAAGPGRVTRHVVFLYATESGVVCGYGAKRVTDLPTFLRTTRSNVFTAPQPGFLSNIHRTVDLYSSPGACVMEGVAGDIERDTAVIRKLEGMRLPVEVLQKLAEAAASAAEVTRLHTARSDLEPIYEATCQELARVTEERNLLLEAASRTASSRESSGGSPGSQTDNSNEEEMPSALLAEPEPEVTGPAARGDEEDTVDPFLDDDDESAEPAPLPLEALFVAIAALHQRTVQIAEEDANLMDALNEQRNFHRALSALLRALLESLADPPLFLSLAEFDLFRRCGFGNLLLLPYHPVTPQQEAEDLLAVKDRRLAELLAKRTEAGNPAAEPASPTGSAIARFLAGGLRALACKFS